MCGTGVAQWADASQRPETPALLAEGPRENDQPLSVRSLGALVRAEGTRFFLTVPSRNSSSDPNGGQSVCRGDTVFLASALAETSAENPLCLSAIIKRGGVGVAGRRDVSFGEDRKNGADADGAGFPPSPPPFATYLLIRETLIKPRKTESDSNEDCPPAAACAIVWNYLAPREGRPRLRALPGRMRGAGELPAKHRAGRQVQPCRRCSRNHFEVGKT